MDKVILLFIFVLVVAMLIVASSESSSTKNAIVGSSLMALNLKKKLREEEDTSPIKNNNDGDFYNDNEGFFIFPEVKNIVKDTDLNDNQTFKLESHIQKLVSNFDDNTQNMQKILCEIRNDMTRIRKRYYDNIKDKYITDLDKLLEMINNAIDNNDNDNNYLRNLIFNTTYFKNILDLIIDSELISGTIENDIIERQEDFLLNTDENNSINSNNLEDNIVETK